MSFWDGYRWTPISRVPPKRPSPSRLGDWIATATMVIVVAAIVVPLIAVRAGTATIVLSPSSGPSGSPVSVAAQGFSPGVRLQLTWDGSGKGMPKVTADDSGSFQATFRVPNSAVGPHSVSTDTSGSRSQNRSSLQSVATSDFTVVSGFASPSPAGPTLSPTATPAPTLDPTPTLAPSVAPTATPTPTLDPTPTLAPSVAPTATPTPTPSATGRTLTFAAEFTQSTGAFAYDGGWGAGFGYQSDFMGDLRQVTVANGVATITATRMQTPSGRPWASAIMSTKGRFAQAYGYFEARIRYTGGNGLWPAFWLDPADYVWPPEIDILEAYPNTTAWPTANRFTSTLIYGPSLQHQIVYDAGYDLSGGWHTYGMDWRSGSITFYLDGQIIGSIAENVPSKQFYLILNLAVGNWSALADSTTPDNSVMQIDYVRAYAN